MMIKLCRHWSFELILSHAKTYHIYLKNYLVRCEMSDMVDSNLSEANTKVLYHTQTVEEFTIKKLIIGLVI